MFVHRWYCRDVTRVFIFPQFCLTPNQGAWNSKTGCLVACSCLHKLYKLPTLYFLFNFLQTLEDNIFTWHGSRGEQRNWFPPKTEHPNFWWQPVFCSEFYFTSIINLYLLISFFSISFFKYHWKMVISIVYLSLKPSVSSYTLIRLC